jgi:hypothetical protein
VSWKSIHGWVPANREKTIIAECTCRARLNHEPEICRFRVSSNKESKEVCQEVVQMHLLLYSLPTGYQQQLVTNGRYGARQIYADLIDVDSLWIQ